MDEQGHYIQHDSAVERRFIVFCWGKMPRAPICCESDEGEHAKSTAWQQQLVSRHDNQITTSTKVLFSNTSNIADLCCGICGVKFQPIIGEGDECDMHDLRSLSIAESCGTAKPYDRYLIIWQSEPCYARHIHWGAWFRCGLVLKCFNKLTGRALLDQLPLSKF